MLSDFFPVLTIIAIGFTVGCIPAPTIPTIQAEETLMPSETPTATIIWFPPTSTFTPLPILDLGEKTVQADLNYRGLLLEDNFDDSQQWTNGKFNSGSILFGVNELSIGVTESEGYLASLRNGPNFGDFYLEVAASPSICRGNDEYGILFHITPSLDFFRFGLSCDGEARLDRLLDGKASSRHPPTVYGAIPPGAPSTSRIGIWSMGKKMKFFVNGAFLFTVEDPSLPIGGIGVYARSGGQEPMTINFSNLKLFEATPE